MTIEPVIVVRLSGRFGGRGRCRSCDQAIVWYETLTGKRMPFNGSPKPARLRRDELDPQRRWIGELLRSEVHWATCPHSTSWRHRQGKRAEE